MAVPVFLLLGLVLAFLLTGAALARRAARTLRVPPVLGEILFGVLLGPASLGLAAPGLREALLGTQTAPWLDAIAHGGLIVFMFLLGLELKPSERDRLGSAWVALGGLVLPLAFGLALALWRPHWFTDHVDDVRPAMFVAIVLTVSALAVLGRILMDVGLLGHPVGSISLGAALWDDVAAWILLAMLTGGSDLGLTGNLAANMAIVAAAALGLAVAVERLPAWLEPLDAAGKTTAGGLLGLAFAAAWFTDQAGLHYFLGPLVVGLATARRPMVAYWIRSRIGRLTQLVLIPVFFILVGARMDPRLLAGAGAVALVGVLVVSTTSKTLGCYLGGRTIGMTHRAAMAIGLLMNARGAVGILVADVGHRTGLLSDLGFTLLVSAAFLTTLATPVAFHLYLRRVGRRGAAA